MKQQKLNLWQVIKSVLFALLGVQKNKNAEQDFLQPGPWPYIIGGIIAVIIFIGTLIYVVQRVVQ